MESPYSRIILTGIAAMALGAVAGCQTAPETAVAAEPVQRAPAAAPATATTAPKVKKSRVLGTDDGPNTGSGGGSGGGPGGGGGGGWGG